jgi:hypothetical protein
MNKKEAFRQYKIRQLKKDVKPVAKEQRINTMNIDPNTPQANQEQANEQATQEVAATESAAQDQAMEATQDSEEGSIEG